MVGASLLALGLRRLGLLARLLPSVTVLHVAQRRRDGKIKGAFLLGACGEERNGFAAKSTSTAHVQRVEADSGLASGREKIGIEDLHHYPWWACLQSGALRSEC